MTFSDYKILDSILNGEIPDSHHAEETIQSIIAAAEKQIDDHEQLFRAWAARFRLAGRKSIYESARDKYHVDSDLVQDLTRDELGFLLMQEVQRGCEQGMDLFFTDHQLGAHGALAVESLQKIGAIEHANLFKEILKIYGNGPTGDQGEVLDYFEELTGDQSWRIHEIEDEYFDLRFWSLYGFEWDWRENASSHHSAQ